MNEVSTVEWEGFPTRGQCCPGPFGLLEYRDGDGDPTTKDFAVDYRIIFTLTEAWRAMDGDAVLRWSEVDVTAGTPNTYAYTAKTETITAPTGETVIESSWYPVPTFVDAWAVCGPLFEVEPRFTVEVSDDGTTWTEPANQPMLTEPLDYRECFAENSDFPRYLRITIDSLAWADVYNPTVSYPVDIEYLYREIDEEGVELLSETRSETMPAPPDPFPQIVIDPPAAAGRALVSRLRTMGSQRREDPELASSNVCLFDT